MRRVAATLWAAIACAASRADACPCRGTTGPSSALTGVGERAGVAAGVFARRATGAFDDRGGFHPYGGSVRDRALGLSLALGGRPAPSTELSISGELALASFAAGSERRDDALLGDTTLRLRQELVAQPPHAPGWLSLVALGGAVRAPTATTASGSAAGSSPSAPGLGAWELAALGDARARVGTPLVETGLSLEVAVRAPDHATGAARRLGPRQLARVAVLAYPSPAWTLGVHGDVAREGEVRYDGRLAPGSDQRLFSLGAWASRRTDGGWRASAFVVGGLPVAGKNAVVSTIVGLSVAVSR